MSRPTYTQMEVLLKFLEENRRLARGELRTAQGKLETKAKWEEIAMSLNAAGRVNKDAKGWAKFWADKKYALKKHLAQLNASGTDTEAVAPLSEIEEKFLEVIGGRPTLQGGDNVISAPKRLEENQRLSVRDEEAASSPQSMEDPLDPAPSSSDQLRFSFEEASIRHRARRRRHSSQSPSEREQVIADLIYSRFQRERDARSERIASALDNLAEAVRVSGENMAGALNHLANNVRSGI